MPLSCIRMGRHPFVEFVFSTGVVGCIAVKNKFDLAALDHDALYLSTSRFQCLQTAFHLCLNKITPSFRHCLNPLLASGLNRMATHLLPSKNMLTRKLWNSTHWAYACPK